MLAVMPCHSFIFIFLNRAKGKKCHVCLCWIQHQFHSISVIQQQPVTLTMFPLVIYQYKSQFWQVKDNVSVWIRGRGHALYSPKWHAGSRLSLKPVPAVWKYNAPSLSYLLESVSKKNKPDCILRCFVFQLRSSSLLITSEAWFQTTNHHMGLRFPISRYYNTWTWYSNFKYMSLNIWLTVHAGVAI